MIFKPETGTIKILDYLGEGSTGRVFKAIRIDSRGFSKQTVAIKVLKAGVCVQNLIAEMETLTKVRSPYCVGLMGWENLKEGPALVMEWIDGVSLQTLSKFKRLGPEARDEIAFQVQEGLAAIHRAGLVHGDLSPSNILVDRAGNVRLADFGLSSGAEFNRGTIRYISPERWNGLPPSHTDDLFSLGLICLELGEEPLESVLPAEAWKRRAIGSASDSGLLARDPSRRRPLMVQSKLAACRRLGQDVTELMKFRQSLACTEDLRLTRRSAHRSGFAAALFAVLLAPNGPAGRFDIPSSQASAVLEVRTTIWVDVQLDRVAHGFSPLAFEGIPAGVHSLEWRSRDKSGSIKIALGFGQRRLLTDADFGL